MTKLPPKGTPVEKLRCKHCGNLRSELDPKDCTDANCPHKVPDQ